jgi:hypothetical protein
MRIALNKWFSLPRLGRETFADLMKARVKYDTKLGFKFTGETDVSRALHVLSKALDQAVELKSSCFICEQPLEETEPQGATICGVCLAKDDAYTLYTMRFASLIE